MDTRQNHRSMSAPQKSAFVSAVLRLKNNVDSVLAPGDQSRYDDFVQVHKNAMIGPDMFMPMPHSGPLFFPWHRVLLRQFELALQSAAQDTSITVPYWDWDLSGASNPFNDDFLGGDGDSAQNHRVIAGPFAFANGQFNVRIWDDSPGDSALLREFGADPTAFLPTTSDVTTILKKTPYWPDPNSWEVTCEGLLHNPVHRWIGGNMADATSPNDPAFFLHHCYLDYLWERWKTQHPSMDPYLPVSGGNGMDLTSTLVFNNNGQPAPWVGLWKVQDTLNTQSLGYEYA
jgi:tyrosinase